MSRLLVGLWYVYKWASGAKGTQPQQPYINGLDGEGRIYRVTNDHPFFLKKKVNSGTFYLTSGDVCVPV